MTIARFRAGFADAVAGFFAEVLGLCARLGMGRLGVVALDGTKIAASASMSANRAEETLAKLAAEMVAAHARADAAEDELFGPGQRGDEVPPDAWRPGRRDERIAAALAQLQAEREAAEQAEQAKAAEFRARRAAGQRTGAGPAVAAVALAEENLARVRAARAAQLAGLERRYAAGEPRRRYRDPGTDDYCRVRAAAVKVESARARAAAAAGQARARQAARGRVRNVTDPDSRLMPVRGGGFVQGYNAQNVTSEDGLIIATALTQDTGDVAWYQPMTAAAAEAAALIAAHRPAGQPGGDDRIGLVLADAGYLSEANLTCAGPDRLIATGKRRDLEAAAREGTSSSGEPGGNAAAGPAAAMAARLKTPAAITAYRHRGHIAETPHGHIKHNLGFRQLTLRGKRKAEAEWAFTCAISNLLKAITSSHLTSQALAASAR